MRIPIIAAAGLLILSGGVSAQDKMGATAELKRANGEHAGSVALRETPANGVLLTIEVRGLDAGVYAIHIHETGSCEPPSFETAGGHFAPHARSHGILHENGPHGGDLLNLHVPESGALTTERLAAHVTLEAGQQHSLFDTDGSAIVLHAGRDDYVSQPSGDAGDRLACGVVTR